MNSNLKKYIFLIFLLCSLIFLCSFVNAQTITIEGRLIDRESKSPIPNIEISSFFYEDNEEIIETVAITDNNGVFRFDLNLINPQEIWNYNFIRKEKVKDSFQSRYHEELFSLLIHNGISQFIFKKNFISEYTNHFERVDRNSGEEMFFNITENIIDVGDIYPVRKDYKIIKFKGYLLDQITLEPIVNAKIGNLQEKLVGIPGITNEQGYFEFDVLISNDYPNYSFKVDNVADYYNVNKYYIVYFESEYYDIDITEFTENEIGIIKPSNTIKRENRLIHKNYFDGWGKDEFFDKTDSEIDLGNLYLYPMFDMLIESDVDIMIEHDDIEIANNLDSYTTDNGYMKRAYIKKFLPVNYQSKLLIVRSHIFQDIFELKTPIGNPKEEFIYVVYDNNNLTWEILPILERPRISDITYNDAQVINEKEKEKIDEEFYQIIHKAGQEYFNKYGFVHTNMPPRSIASIDILIKEGLLSEDFYTKYCYGCYEFNNQTFFEDNCFDFGFRRKDQYCSESGTFNNMILPGELCNNNYECESNSCSEEGFCNKNSFTQRLINWLSKIFS